MKKTMLLLLLAAVPLAAEDPITKVVQVKNRPAESLARLLPGFGFGVTPSRDFNTITLTGPADKVKVAEAIIAQYDTTRRQAEFVVRVIQAGTQSSKMGAAAGDAPSAPTKVVASKADVSGDAADLVPAELKSILRYTAYSQRDSAVLRGMEAESLLISLAGGLSCRMNFRVRDAENAPLIELGFTMRGAASLIQGKNGQTTYEPALVETSSTLKSGETVVLGASKMQGGGNALIVLLTAKLLP